MVKWRTGSWLFVVSLGIYRPGFGRRTFWNDTVTSYELALPFVFLYASRQVPAHGAGGEGER